MLPDIRQNCPPVTLHFHCQWTNQTGQIFWSGTRDTQTIVTTILKGLPQLLRRKISTFLLSFTLSLCPSWHQCYQQNPNIKLNSVKIRSHEESRNKSGWCWCSGTASVQNSPPQAQTWHRNNRSSQLDWKFTVKVSPYILNVLLWAFAVAVQCPIFYWLLAC